MIDDLAQKRITDHIASSNMARDFLNISVEKFGAPMEFRMAFNELQVGNPIIRALHGGIVSTFLQTCGRYTAFSVVEPETQVLISSIHVNYLNSTKPEDMICTVDVEKAGRRLLFLEATGWQSDKTRKVARAAIGVRVIRPEEHAKLESNASA